MAKKSISRLQHGDEVTLHFHGSKRNGNDPYDLNATFLRYGIDEEDGSREAVFDIGPSNEFTAYFWNGRWRYGSSAECLSIA